jgi:hypothetical protein
VGAEHGANIITAIVTIFAERKFIRIFKLNLLDSEYGMQRGPVCSAMTFWNHRTGSFSLLFDR